MRTASPRRAARAAPIRIRHNYINSVPAYGTLSFLSEGIEDNRAGVCTPEMGIILPMDIKTQLSEAMKRAMKANDDVARRTTRMALAGIKQAEVDRQTTLDDAAVMSLLQKEIKNRREAIEEARKANRPDLISDNEAEIKVLEGFLPKAMDPEELGALARAAIEETGASVPADMGKVMKVLMPKVAGRAAGDQVSAAVKELLSK